MVLREIHTEAMDLAEKAMIARTRGNSAAARKYLKKALRKEQEAARFAVETGVPEPTRSILLKSAAHLAMDCGEGRLAEQLVSTALAGDPPAELAHELRGLFEEINFHRHLDLQGIELQSNDLQMVLVGHAIAQGMAESDEFVHRIETLQKLIYRTSEGEQELEYRTRGAPKRVVQRPLQLFVSVPRAASFAVSLRVAHEKHQEELQFSESSLVLDQLLDRLEMFDREEHDALREVMPTPDYFDKFMDLAAKLAPDGERVSMVGFTTQRDGEDRHVKMTRPAQSGRKRQDFVPSKRSKRFQGRVFFVNTKDEDHSVIKLLTKDGTELQLQADEDVLQKFAGFAGRKTQLTVTGAQTSKTVLQVEDFKKTAVRRTTKKRTRKAAK